MPLLFPILITLLIATTLIVLGLRGRRVGDHPYCRRCGFDLFGRPEDSTRCPECGLDLGLRRATVIGVRQRRRWALRLGVTMFVPTACIAGALMTGVARDVDWQKQKPSWWLAREADSPVAATRDAALKELILRLERGQLSNSRVRHLVAAGIKHQADANAAWVYRWGDLIESARSRKLVPDDQWRTYLDTAIANYHTLVFRRQLHVTDSPTYLLRINGARIGRSMKWSFGMRQRRMSIDGRELSLRSGSYGTLPISPGSFHTGFINPRDAEQVMAGLEPGTHTGVLHVDFCIFQSVDEEKDGESPAAMLDRLRRSATQPATPPLQPAYVRVANSILDAGRNKLDTTAVVANRQFPFTFEIVGPHVEIPRRLTDPAMRKQVIDSITVSDPTIEGNRLRRQLDCRNPPCEMSFIVFARVAGKELRLGQFTMTPTTPMRGTRTLIATWRRGEEVRTETMDLILRPDPAAAQRRADIEQFWGEEVILKDISVKVVPTGTP